MKTMIAFALLLLGAAGQPAAFGQSYLTIKCALPAGAKALPAGTVYLLYTGPQGYPFCMHLGDGFKTSIDPVSKMMRLDLVQSPEPTLRLKQIVEVVKQPELNIPQSSHTLAFTPAPDTLLNVVYDSPVTGRTSFMIAAPEGTDRKLIQITWEAPNGNPELQQVRVVYWTYDALALAVTTAAPINTAAPRKP